MTRGSWVANMSIIKPHTRKTKQGEPPVKGRFAPSPTGRMHAGNIFSALVAWLIAKSQGGKIVLRIEDLDAQRSKQRYIDAVMRDFEALGLFWDEGPFFQHDREEAYESAFRMLEEKGLVYPVSHAHGLASSAFARHYSRGLGSACWGGFRLFRHVPEPRFFAAFRKKSCSNARRKAHRPRRIRRIRRLHPGARLPEPLQGMRGLRRAPLRRRICIPARCGGG